MKIVAFYVYAALPVFNQYNTNLASMEVYPAV